MNEIEKTGQAEFDFAAPNPAQKEPSALPPFLRQEGFYFVALGGAEKSA